MKRTGLLALVCCALFAPGAVHAALVSGGTGKELAAAVARAAQSPGFRLRAMLSREGDETAPVARMRIIGADDGRHRQLLVRALAPQAWRDHSVLFESGAGAAVRAYASSPQKGAGTGAADPYAPLFGSALVGWDLMGAWWHWPVQARVRSATLRGRACVVVDSSGGRGPVAKVRSWISAELRLPLRVEFHAADGRLLRAVEVDKVLRRADGSGAARSFLVTLPGEGAWRVDIYDAEDGVALAPDAFNAQGGGDAAPAQATP